MDTPSIVSFHNDSTLKSTLKYNSENVSVHELALHAMRDRCLLLQRRINSLETENMKLKLDITKGSQYSPWNEEEKLHLHQKIAELSKQKSQLTHHVFMVTCENKSLWNKIANINRTENQPVKEMVSPKRAPLIRTNTYIHSTPKTAGHEEIYSEPSLEEISLKLINSYIQEKSHLVEQYEQMTRLQDEEDILNVDSIGFTYIEEPATDSLKEIRNQTEKLYQLKKELLQQEQDLKCVISQLKTCNGNTVCKTCVVNAAKQVKFENKEIETSDSLANWATPADSTIYENFNEPLVVVHKKDDNELHNQQLTQGVTDKTCPMCGNCFNKSTSFAEFQKHVENHFVGDAEPYSLLDHFENIHAVDNII